MIKVLFICHGNICRSPMSEFILKDMVTKRGISNRFQIASAATSREEIGNPVYPPARRKLLEHGIDPSGKTARQMTRRDYEEYDYILAAEQYNIRTSCASLAEIRIIRSIAFWIFPTGRVTLTIPGIPEILIPPGTISWKAAKPFWIG